MCAINAWRSAGHQRNGMHDAGSAQRTLVSGSRWQGAIGSVFLRRIQKPPAERYGGSAISVGTEAEVADFDESAGRI